MSFRCSSACPLPTFTGLPFCSAVRLQVYQLLLPLQAELNATEKESRDILPPGWAIPRELHPYCSKAILQWSLVFASAETSFRLAFESQMNSDEVEPLHIFPEIHWSTLVLDAGEVKKVGSDLEEET